ncbi:MAG: hypothetical protein FWF44_11760, partial [Defluviitaleaceae bacterium]|nr:hypothetical protein [Defluviitaleaceae bacterium]
AYITSDVTPAPVVTTFQQYIGALSDNFNAGKKQFSLVVDATDVFPGGQNSSTPFDLVGLSKGGVDLWILDAAESINSSEDVYFYNGKMYSYETFTATYEYDIEDNIRAQDPAGLDKEHLAMYNAINKVLNTIITPGMSDYDKELAIHDYLAANVAYDASGGAPDASHKAYGALVNRLAVCNGYCKAFKLLMDLEGVPCDVVYGTASDSGENIGHAWNRVCLDGDWYNVDVTFDATGGRTGAPFMIYDYFNVTDSLLGRDHTPYLVSDKKCSATEYDYFVRNGLIAQNTGDARDLIEAAVQAGRNFAAMRGVSQASPAFDIPAIVNGSSLNSYFSGRTYWYWVDPVMNTAYIYWGDGQN